MQSLGNWEKAEEPCAEGTGLRCTRQQCGKQPPDLNRAKKTPKGVHYVLIVVTPEHLFKMLLI